MKLSQFSNKSIAIRCNLRTPILSLCTGMLHLHIVAIITYIKNAGFAMIVELPVTLDWTFPATIALNMNIIFWLITLFYPNQLMASWTRYWTFFFLISIFLFFKLCFYFMQLFLLFFSPLFLSRILFLFFLCFLFNGLKHFFILAHLSTQSYILVLFTL